MTVRPYLIFLAPPAKSCPFSMGNPPETDQTAVFYCFLRNSQNALGRSGSPSQSYSCTCRP
eukprot:943179-Prymnesium_polylepis.1